MGNQTIIPMQYSGFLQGLDHAEYVGIDSETTGFRVKEGEDYLQGFSLAYTLGGMTFSEYFPFRHKEDNLPLTVLQYVIDALESKTLFFHNRKFDLHSFMTISTNLSEIFAYDTMLLAQLINEEFPYEKSLENCGRHYIKRGKVNKEAIDRFTETFGWGSVPPHLMAPYAKGDAELTLALGMHLLELFNKKFGKQAEELWQVEFDMNNSLFRMEQRGIHVDLDFCRQYQGIATLEMALVESDLGFQPSKSTQLAKFLFEDLSLPILERTPAGKPKMDKGVMEEYERMLARVDDHRAQLVLNFRGWQKANSTFYKPFQTLVDPTGRIHCNYKQNGTVTGRLSCTDPNLQQIPRLSDKVWNGKIRSAFRATPGFGLMGFDYSQLEFRLAAAYGTEQWLIDEFAKSDADPFTVLSERIGTDRYTAKTFTYAMIYGAGQEKIAKTLNRKVTEIEDSYDAFLSTIPGIIRAKNLAGAKARSRGYIRYWTGRRRHFRYPEDSYKAFNALLQGGGAEVVKRVLVRIDKEICDNDCRLLLQVHDELVFEIRQGMEAIYAPRIIEAMAKLPTDFFGVNFTVSGKAWGDD
jgi:DNA polymerase I